MRISSFFLTVTLFFLAYCLPFFSANTASAKTQAKAPLTTQVLTPRDIFRKSVGIFGGDIFLLAKRGNFLLDDRDFLPESLHPSTVDHRMLPPHPITMHGFAWDYDLNIPITFYDPTSTWIKPGKYKELAVQQDIAPTLAHILGISSPAKDGGRILVESLEDAIRAKSPAKRPKAIVVFVQDQTGSLYLKTHPQNHPFYDSLSQRGATYLRATVAHVDVETSVGHAAIGTGAWPKEHGIAGNNLFNPGTWQSSLAQSSKLTPTKQFAGSPAFFFTPTLADLWTVARSGKPKVLSLAYAPRAAIGMGGHGALFNHGYKTHVVWMDENNPGANTYTTEADNYQLPSSFNGKFLRPFVDELVKSTNGKWHNHEIINSKGEMNFLYARATPAAPRFEADLVVGAIDELAIGRSEETDLVYVNMKATDACGHMYGFESEECGEVLSAADSSAQRIVEAIAKATNNSYIAVVTADHGAAPLPEISGGRRWSRDQLKRDLNKFFHKPDNGLDSILAITSSMIYVNRGQLAAGGYTVSDVVKFLKAYKVKMAAPYNALSDEWLKKGSSPEELFFEDVVAREDL